MQLCEKFHKKIPLKRPKLGCLWEKMGIKTQKYKLKATRANSKNRPFKCVFKCFSVVLWLFRRFWKSQKNVIFWSFLTILGYFAWFWLFLKFSNFWSKFFWQKFFNQNLILTYIFHLLQQINVYDQLKRHFDFLNFQIFNFQGFFYYKLKKSRIKCAF